MFLIRPLVHIFNACLCESKYPEIWKLEYVTPLPKCPNPKKISDLRKLALTSDYSKLFEGFLKDWILEDISENLDPSQYGARKGTGTEHLIVKFVDRVLKQLDYARSKSAVLAASVDWAAAFDRLDPTITIKKFISMGVRPSLVPILVSYMTNRRMIVKFIEAESSQTKLIG